MLTGFDPLFLRGRKISVLLNMWWNGTSLANIRNISGIFWFQLLFLASPLQIFSRSIPRSVVDHIPIDWNSRGDTMGDLAWPLGFKVLRQAPGGKHRVTKAYSTEYPGYLSKETELQLITNVRSPRSPLSSLDTGCLWAGFPWNGWVLNQRNEPGSFIQSISKVTQHRQSLINHIFPFVVGQTPTNDG